MKNLLLIAVLSTFLLGADRADEIETLKQEIHQLKKESRTLHKELETLRANQERNYDELYDYTENVETRILEDKIKFGLGLKFNLDNFDKKCTNGETVKNTNVLSTKFMLKMRANITDNLHFHGRVSMYKYWGSAYTHPYSYYDNMQGRVPSDSSLYVERAYVDWFFNQEGSVPMAFTIGRQPSSDGPSHQFKENLKRKATYSALLYDGAADGAVLTLNFSKLLDYPKTYLRFGYAKGFGHVNTDEYVGNAYIGASNDDIKDTNVVGVFFDTTVAGMKNSLVQVSYSRLYDIIANPLDSNYTNNKNIGDMDLLGAMIEVQNIANTHLDLFAHYGYNITHPNGNRYVVNGYSLGLLCQGSGCKSQNGYAYWVGGRYGFGEKGKYKVGFEYNHGSRYWTNLTQGSFDLYNKLATRGDGYEGYLMYVVNRYLNFRAGYVLVDYDYSRSGWFVSEPVGFEAANSQEALKLQSYYLKMNLNY